MRSVSILPVLLLPFASCATICNPGPDAVPISSQPPGATVFVDGAAVGVTPMTVILNRSGQRTILLRLAGYQDQQIALSTSFNGWFVGTLLLAPILGTVIDLLASNVTTWDTTPISVVLTPATSAPATPSVGGLSADPDRLP